MKGAKMFNDKKTIVTVTYRQLAMLLLDHDTSRQEMLCNISLCRYGHKIVLCNNHFEKIFNDLLKEETGKKLIRGLK